MKNTRTKIVATIGPASTRNEQVLLDLLNAGVDVARINFSHGSHETVRAYVTMLRRAAAKIGLPLAILGDLQGPKLRIGKIPNEQELLQLQVGEMLTLSADPADADNDKIIPFPHPELFPNLQPSARVVMGDGEVELQVQAKEGLRIYCSVSVEGPLGSRKGVNLPGTPLPISSISEKDQRDLALACELEFDFIAMSFVRSPEDVLELRQMMKERHNKEIPIIAKIEKSEALEVLEEIGNVANGMMVARGDLGIDCPPYEVPIHQKRIIRLCNRLGKPVITATQMLDSMKDHPTPTRAEASDVANAILDGTDAVMLSNESAMGKYPVQAVAMMNNIAYSTEKNYPYKEWENKRREQLSDQMDDSTEAMTMAVPGMARRLHMKAIIINTEGGRTARYVARYRPEQPIFAVTHNPKTQRILQLVWGVESLLISAKREEGHLVQNAARTVGQTGQFSLGDTVIVMGETSVGQKGKTNLLVIRDLTAEDVA